MELNKETIITIRLTEEEAETLITEVESLADIQDSAFQETVVYELKEELEAMCL